MSLALSEEQELLKSTAREFVAEHAPVKELRKLREQEVDCGRWRAGEGLRQRKDVQGLPESVAEISERRDIGEPAFVHPARLNRCSRQRFEVDTAEVVRIRRLDGAKTAVVAAAMSGLQSPEPVGAEARVANPSETKLSRAVSESSRVPVRNSRSQD